MCHFHLAAVFSRSVLVTLLTLDLPLVNILEETYAVSETKGFYEQDGIPAICPSVSKYWIEHRALKLTSGLTWSFFIYNWISSWRGIASLALAPDTSTMLVLYVYYW